MWLCLSSAFLSIVHKPPCRPYELLVRARRPGDIESVFPEAKITRKTDCDYLYRAIVSKGDVASVLAKAVASIDYPNFKNTVKDTGLHDAYFEVWASMAKVQPLPPYSGNPSSEIYCELDFDSPPPKKTLRPCEGREGEPAKY